MPSSQPHVGQLVTKSLEPEGSDGRVLCSQSIGNITLCRFHNRLERASVTVMRPVVRYRPSIERSKILLRYEYMCIIIDLYHKKPFILITCLAVANV